MWKYVSVAFHASAHSLNPIMICVYPRKWRWPDLNHSNSNLSNSHSPSHSIHVILFETNTLAFLLHLHLLWSSSLPLALHFKLQRFSQNMPIIPPQHMPVPTYSICHGSTYSPPLYKEVQVSKLVSKN